MSIKTLSNRLSAVLLAAAFCATTAMAETASPYTIDFETAVATNTSAWGASNRDFKIATGWDHVVGYFEAGYRGNYYVAYEFKRTGGVDGSQALYAGSNYYSNSYYGSGTAEDYLVTPPLTGATTIAVKKYVSSGSIHFYKFSMVDGALTKGDEITFAEELTTDGFTTVSLGDLPENTRVGIQMSSVLIDNLTAASADVTPRAMLKVESVTPSSASKVACDAEGNFTIELNGIVTNVGEKALDASVENYSVSIATDDDNATVLATLPLTADLAIGSSLADIIISATLKVADYPAVTGEGLKFRFVENCSGSYLTTGLITAVPYEVVPELVYSAATNRNTTLADGATFDMGTSREDIGMMLSLNNTGGKTMNVTEVVVPEGFTCNLAAGTAIDALGSARFAVTRSAAVTGTKSGALIIKYDGGQLSLNLAGRIATEGEFFCNFEANDAAASMKVDLEYQGYSKYGWNSHYTNDMGYPGNDYSAQTNFGSSDAAYGPYDIVTPKLAIAQGDIISFDAAKVDDKEAHLDVLYSTDRLNWTALHEYSSTAADPTFLITSAASYKYGKAFSHFEISDMPAGEYYIAFRGHRTDEYPGSIRLDNICGGAAVAVTRDVSIVKADFAANGEVNSPLKATVTLRNLLATPVAGDDYTVCVYLKHTDGAADELLASKPGAEIAGPAFSGNGYIPDNDFAFDLTFTPHSVFNADLYAKVVFTDGAEILSAPVTVNVMGEVYVSETRIGGEPNNSGSHSGPFPVYNNNGECSVIYTPEMLNGLAAGTVIKSIKLRGYNNSSYGGAKTFDVKVWMANTDQSVFSKDDDSKWIYTAKEDMTQVYEGQMVLDAIPGSSETNHVDIYTMNLQTPFVYDGRNLNIYFRNECSSWSSCYFEVTTSSTTQAIYRESSSSATALDGASFKQFESSTAKIPVLYVGLEAEPKTLSGTVTAADTQEPVAGVKVLCTSGDVQYSATTDEAGNYSMSVMKDKLEYVVTAEDAPGFFPINIPATFEESKTLNIALKTAVGPFVDSFAIDADAMVNHEIKAKAVLANYTTEDFAADSYTARLMFGDAVVKELPAVAVAAGEKAVFDFSFTPHAAGTFAAVPKFVMGDLETEVTPVDVTVAEEFAAGDLVIGTEVIRSNKSAVSCLYQHNEGEFIYTADEIGALPGTIIKHLGFSGYVSGVKVTGGYSTKVRVYIENTEDDLSTTTKDNFTPRDVNEMTLIYSNDEYLLDNVGSDAEPVEILPMDVNFVYTGHNLRVHYMISTTSSSSWCQMYICNNNVEGNSFLHQGDGQTIDDLETVLSTALWKTAYKPVLYAQVVASKDVAGTVTDADTQEPIAGANVRMASGDVYYEAETDDQGQYSLTVYQTSLDFTLQATAPGYADYAREIGVLGEGATFTEDIVLQTIKTVSGVVTDAVTNEPLADVAVTVAAADDIKFVATTDATGAYSLTIDKLEPEYTITAALDGYDTVSESLGVITADVTKDLTLRLAAIEVSGVVVDKVTQEPIVGANVLFAAGDTEETVSTDGEGHFALTINDVYPSYDVTVSAAGYDSFTTTIERVEPSDAFNVELKKSAIEVTGTITDETGAAVAGAAVDFTATESVTVFSDEQGHFAVTIDDVYQQYTMTVTADGYEDYTAAVGEITADNCVFDVVLKANVGVRDLVVRDLKAFGSNGAIIVNATAKTAIVVCDVAGRVIRKATVEAGLTRMPIVPGVYMINGVKVLVK
ncbi:MAG: carboxypeptidase regulatory-like domain-containing protein [Muribaculaceae bacterium]